ncbi:MAG TPA: metallophosphoesterase [Bryobacteraceae bacterium]|nr:metallophosphoesterase [Bryobacteraceae bacterium]
MQSSIPKPGRAIATTEPHFAEPTPSTDLRSFTDRKPDSQYYKMVNARLLQPIPAPRDPANVTLTLADVWGSAGTPKVAAMKQAKKLVFHCVGDTGPSPGAESSLASVSSVADKMVADFKEADPSDAPLFFYHLGDVVYSFGEAQYYYDEFFEPFREYNAPIIAIPGNHDGVTYTGDPSQSLNAFLQNFCSSTFAKTADSGSLRRTSMIQPGVYFTFDATLVRILGLYSNVLEDPGVISSEGSKSSPVSDVQLAFLQDQLAQIKKTGFAGAILVAVHHPPFSGPGVHGPSPRMLQDLDSAFSKTGCYPHAILSGHAHNYQRFTRTAKNGSQTPYIVAGCGGHSISQLKPLKGGGAIRTPLKVNDTLTFDKYFAEYGYLRIVVTPALLRIEYHQAAAGVDTKSAADTVTVDLKTRKLTTALP